MQGLPWYNRAILIGVYMLVLTFPELSIDSHTYNGMEARQARAEVINVAADAITMARYAHPSTNIETLYDWARAKVDFVRQRIEVPPTRFDDWVAINS